MTKTSYAIHLPKTLPQELFGNLGSDISQDTMDSIESDYSDLRQRFTQTIASSPIDAIGHVLFRNLGATLNTRTLVKMFRNHPSVYATEIPERDYADPNGKTFQEMELAVEIGHVRGVVPERCFNVAARILSH